MSDLKMADIKLKIMDRLIRAGYLPEQQARPQRLLMAPLAVSFRLMPVCRLR
jgi:hypothetical protein